jgi:hypothetical protein
MRTRAIFGLLLVVFLVVPASADVIEAITLEVSQIDNIAVRSDFSGASEQLAWSAGGIATIYYSGGTQKYRVTVDALWDSMTDLSSGGIAAASFASGNFGATFFALTDPGKTTPLGSLGGELYPGWTYEESETSENPSQLYGAAPIRLTLWNVPGFSWAEGLGSMGAITASTTNLFSTWGDISDYGSDWWSNNTIVTLLADESGIPEPATMVLLGLGSLGLISRKRS